MTYENGSEGEESYSVNCGNHSLKWIDCNKDYLKIWSGRNCALHPPRCLQNSDQQINLVNDLQLIRISSTTSKFPLILPMKSEWSISRGAEYMLEGTNTNFSFLEFSPRFIHKNTGSVKNTLTIKLCLKPMSRTGSIVRVSQYLHEKG